MNELLHYLLVLGVFLSVGVLIHVLVCWQLEVDTTWHKLYCICHRCDRERIEREIRYREYRKREDEIRRAIDELSHDK